MENIIWHWRIDYTRSNDRHFNIERIQSNLKKCQENNIDIFGFSFIDDIDRITSDTRTLIRVVFNWLSDDAEKKLQNKAFCFISKDAIKSIEELQTNTNARYLQSTLQTWL